MLWHKKTPECNSRNKTHSNGIARRKLTSITASPFTASVVIFRILRFPNIDWRAIVPLLTKHSHQNPAYCDYSETEKERKREREKEKNDEPQKSRVCDGPIAESTIQDQRPCGPSRGKWNPARQAWKRRAQTKKSASGAETASHWISNTHASCICRCFPLTQPGRSSITSSTSPHPHPFSFLHKQPN